MSKSPMVVVAVVVGLVGAACASSSPEMAPSPVQMSRSMDLAEEAAGAEAPPPPPGADGRRGEGGIGAKRAANEKDARPSPAEPDDQEADAKPDGEGPQERTRAWFPEAFLWQPLVATGADGTATVPFTVPDSLTTWRVLALAHDRSGQQTGAVATFDSTLPVYVDPVVPGWLFAGDRLSLPVQVMNNTTEPVSGVLTVEAAGPVSGLGTASIDLRAGASDVRALPLVATGAGEAVLTARWQAGGASDAAERRIPVLPAGRPVVNTTGGTLTDRRALQVAGARGADPATEELEVVLFGGPLAVVQAELARLAGGGRPTNAAYGFALTGQAEGLAAAAGTELSADALRKVRLLAWQRVVREARAADAGRATDLLQAMQGELGVEAAGPVRTALVRAVVDGQRADGTWGRRPSSPLQEVLVNTAWSGRVVPADQQAARLRAGAGLERFLHEVKDPYTASVLVASGLLDPDAVARLRELVAAGVVRDDAGVPRVDVPAGVVNAWAFRPSPAEAAAFAVLALEDGPDRRDLAAALLSGWSATGGFGAGPADPLALEAVVAALPATPAASAVRVLAGGVEVAAGRFDPARPGEPLVLTSRPEAGAELELVAEPPLAGVAFVATRRSWVPWSAADRVPGVDVAVTPSALAVAAEGRVLVEVSAPSGRRVTVEVPLPAGAAPDVASVLAANPGLGADRLAATTDRVVWTTTPFEPAAAQRLVLPVTPAFAGEFSTAPVLVSVDGGGAVPVRPPRFRVEPPSGS